MSENFDNQSGFTSDDQLWSLGGYIIPLVALIALFIEDKKNRPFIRYNAVHALGITVLTIVLSFTMCLWVIPYFYGLYLGFQAYNGKVIEVPVLTKFALDQGWIEKLA